MPYIALEAAYSDAVAPAALAHVLTVSPLHLVSLTSLSSFALLSSLICRMMSSLYICSDCLDIWRRVASSRLPNCLGAALPGPSACPFNCLSLVSAAVAPLVVSMTMSLSPRGFLEWSVEGAARWTAEVVLSTAAAAGSLPWCYLLSGHLELRSRMRAPCAVFDTCLLCMLFWSLGCRPEDFRG